MLLPPGMWQTKLLHSLSTGCMASGCHSEAASVITLTAFIFPVCCNCYRLDVARGRQIRKIGGRVFFSHHPFMSSPYMATFVRESLSLKYMESAITQIWNIPSPGYGICCHHSILVFCHAGIYPPHEVRQRWWRGDMGGLKGDKEFYALRWGFATLCRPPQMIVDELYGIE